MIMVLGMVQTLDRDSRPRWSWIGADLLTSARRAMERNPPTKKAHLNEMLIWGEWEVKRETSKLESKRDGGRGEWGSKSRASTAFGSTGEIRGSQVHNNRKRYEVVDNAELKVE